MPAGSTHRRGQLMTDVARPAETQTHVGGEAQLPIDATIGKRDGHGERRRSRSCRGDGRHQVSVTGDQQGEIELPASLGGEETRGDGDVCLLLLVGVADCPTRRAHHLSAFELPQAYGHAGSAQDVQVPLVTVDGTRARALDVVSQGAEVGHFTETALAGQSVKERETQSARRSSQRTRTPVSRSQSRKE